MNHLALLQEILTANVTKDTAAAIVMVQEVRPDGSSLVQDYAGNVFAVNGGGVPAGGRAFVRGLTILSTVPNLPAADFYV
ncbi:MAG: hypothetical protein GY862_13560 [Gammaproteobacteria bacterium]|nr:hypothetical protein [Gammaproteobacteria bacterium]